MPPPKLRPVTASIKTADLNWDLPVLDLHDFVPEGARVIDADSEYPEMFANGYARFSAGDQQISRSPDMKAYLSLDNTSEKAGKAPWLVLQSSGSPNNDPVILTNKPIEALWSPFSDRFAVNHWANPQARDFFVVVIGVAQRMFIDVSPLVDIHFPSEGIPLRRAAKAHRWTVNGDLVVRYLFQRMEEPYSVFGCEVQVALSGNAISLTMLRGFIND